MEHPRIIGQNRPLKISHIWGILIRLELEDHKEGKVIAALAKYYPKLTAKMVIEMDDHVSLASVKAELEAA
ncbi:MAG: hypothetical protein CBB67_021910 [Alteromonadaceae bacterium TMED7]|uniref:Uncharacterized protein n=1 Tax=Alteromonas alba TaxID=2079529 RepID=A0A2S9VEZ5_9ALTE|nr:hypothetical protein [Alteromonas sp.]PRO75041.1 hypothetical protein C6Y40_03310 [Alteromonas alba]RPH12955.1 MAG: hypothetical protein CBB67_021910 [Alteromonadaceae bacterium TMED7]